tara:strand:- start:15 stop:203 length:189 start_codon:yes stop_codon:yes gene_type:complete
MKCLILALLALSPTLPASAAIRYCPENGRPYDTSHGYYVDVPGTAYYVKPSKRPNQNRYYPR